MLPWLVYPYFELDIEQNEIHKVLMIKEETERIEGFCCEEGSFIR